MTDFAKQIKEGTKVSHSAAENTKFVAGFLRGVVDPENYRELIKNFYFVYKCMEEEIVNLKDHPVVGKMYFKDLERTESLIKDLEYYYGPDWEQQIQPSKACEQYLYRIREVAKDNPELLVAHHYTRYLGDLSGGQILKGIAEKALNPPVGKGLDFYEFDSISDAKEFKTNYRSTLDSLDIDQSTMNAMIAEANYAFRLNMYMFDELQGSASKSLIKVLCGLVKSKLGLK